MTLYAEDPTEELIARLEQRIDRLKAQQRRKRVPQGYCDLPTIADFLTTQAGSRDFGQISAGASGELRRMADRLRDMERQNGPGL
jgi:hypothetical protein